MVYVTIDQGEHANAKTGVFAAFLGFFAKGREKRLDQTLLSFSAFSLADGLELAEFLRPLQTGVTDKNFHRPQGQSILEQKPRGFDRLTLQAEVPRVRTK